MIRIALLAACLTLLQTSSDAGLLDLIGPNSCGYEINHNYRFGQRLPYQRLLYIDDLKFESKFMRVRSEELTYPVKGKLSAGLISYIEFLDMNSGRTGGCVYIKKGGVGRSFVTFKLKSQRNHGMEFLIRIYGN